MSLPEFGVKKPVTNLMIFCVILILAFYSLSRLGIDLFPEIEPPSISVISEYPGASPEDVEIKVTEELENQLGTTPGLEKITSFSSEGTSVITLKFIWGTDLDEASNDIRDRIELAKRSLPDIPDEMENPFIFKFNTANIPIIYIGITADKTFPELYDLVDRRIVDKLKQLPGVGTVQVMGGGLERQINIWIDRQRLEGYGLSILDIKNALKNNNITQPVGNIKIGLTDYLIRLPGEFSSPDEINLVILGKYNDRFVYLRDVAQVEDSFKEVTTLVRVNKNPAMMMMVQKQSGTNTVEVAERVKERLKELARTLPVDVKVRVIFDTSQDIISSVNSLKSALWSAIFLVILVVWFFLRRFTASMIVALTIPFSLLISFIYLFLSGKTINMISLSSLAITAGMVVDNAIVVVDNVSRRLDRGQRPQEAAIFGTSEMFLAIAASTLTTVVVFMPLLFLSGVVGKMFGELAAIVIVTLFASLFTATTFSPMLCSKWLTSSRPIASGSPKKKIFEAFYGISERFFTGLEDFYSRMLGWSLRHKKIIIFGFFGAFIMSLFLTRFVGNEFIPDEDSGDIRVYVHLPIGTRLEESDKVAQRIEKIFETDVPEARFYYVRSGQTSGISKSMGGDSGTHIIAAGAKMVPKTERERSDKAVAQALREKFTDIPGVLKTDVSSGNPMSKMLTGGGGKSVQLEIIGSSFKETDALAEKIKGIVENVPGAVDVTISRESNRPEFRIKVDREKAAVLGLDMKTIADAVTTYIQGATATKYREEGKTYDIYVRLEDTSRSRVEDIHDLSMVSMLGGKARRIKLSNIATVYETAGPQEIERKNRERVVKVECNAYGRSTGKVTEDIKKGIEKITLPANVMINFGGEAEEQAKAFKDLTLLLILGIILVYMVMAAQFESLLDPFIVMFAIPFTFIGVILAFIITHTTLSIITFLGIVMLMGIVVNNAIVLISYINILRARGLGMVDAVTTGGKERLRPVLMTTITTLVALMPLALSRGEGSETWQPLGITMIGGLSVSTLITLLFVPTLYSVFEARIRKNGRPRNG
ncbi:MAG: efflux RND transporter permease subunit [Candidatus Omnitrophica bacterium]|nr:efflux RND transporter permease subunit [Candidatus Omnitrophota bacterium]MBL7210298.1 efflux RND transporter permease subunit [Candidatus Omnitrophota bacterium]